MAKRTAEAVIANELEALYEGWWATLDGRERGSAREFLGFGIPDDVAARMDSAGIPPIWGLVSCAGGVRPVRLPRSSLVRFIATRRGGPQRY
jgi:hypothetical protein